MPKNHRRKKHNKKRAARELPQKIHKKRNPFPQLKGTVSRFWQRYKWVWSIIGVLTTLLTIYLAKDPIKKILQSQYENYRDDNIISGILIPGNLPPNSVIYINFGKSQDNFRVSSLRDGVEFNSELIACGKRNAFRMKFKLENNRIYVSTSFIDVLHEELVGVIEYNQWKLYKGQFIDFYNDDKTLEVRDKQGLVMFSLQFKFPNTILLQGYFINETFTTVISDYVFPCIYRYEGWKSVVIEEARKVKSLDPTQ